MYVDIAYALAHKRSLFDKQEHFLMRGLRCRGKVCQQAEHGASTCDAGGITYRPQNLERGSLPILSSKPTREEIDEILRARVLRVCVCLEYA